MVKVLEEMPRLHNLPLIQEEDYAHDLAKDLFLYEISKKKMKKTPEGSKLLILPFKLIILFYRRSFYGAAIFLNTIYIRND